MPTYRRDLHTGRAVPLVEADDLRNGCVTTDKIADGAITSEKLSGAAITNEKIADNSIDGSKFADNSIGSDKVVDGTLSGVKFADGSISGDKIEDNSISGSKLADGSIESVDIKDNTLDGSKLVDNTLDGSKLVDNTLDGSKIKDNSVPGSKLADGAIGAVDIQDNTLSGSKLVDNSVDGAKLVDGAVTTAKLKDNSIDGSKIADGTIQSLDIMDKTISGEKLVNNTITGEKLADGIITNDKLADNSITGDKFLDESISGEKIQPNTIHGSKLEDNTVDGADIINGTLNGNKIADMSVDGDKLADDSIETRHIKSNTITGTKIQDNAIDSTKIRNSSLVGDNFADNAITNAKLQDDSIVNRNIATETLTGDKFVDNTITGDKIVDNTIPGSKIKDGTIENVDIKDNTLSGAKLVDNSISGSKIANNAITSAHLLDNSIPASKILDGTIESIDIKDGTLDGGKVKDNTITGAKLADNAITSAKLSDNSITTDKIVDLAVTEGKIATNAVTNEKISDGSITETKLDTGAVTTNKIDDNAITENKIGTGAVTEGKIGSSAVTNTKIANNAVTTDKIRDGAVTTDKLAPQAVQQITDLEEQFQGNETTRQNNETTRITNETGRVSAESDRVEAETSRVSAETSRDSSETTRQSNETTRQSNETTRENNETTRQSNETQRQTNETNRTATASADHNTAVSDHIQAANDHTTAASDHSVAEEDHTQAVTDHNTAASDHTTATTDHTRAESDHTNIINAIASADLVFDISLAHASEGVLAQYADLAAALGADGVNVPSENRHGGMTVKYVQSSDNKYVSFNYLLEDANTNSKFTNVTNWREIGSDAFQECLCAEIKTINRIAAKSVWNWSASDGAYVLATSAGANAFCVELSFNEITHIKVCKADGTPQNTIFKFTTDSSRGEQRGKAVLQKYNTAFASVKDKVYMYWSENVSDANYCENPEELVIKLYNVPRIISVGLRDNNPTEITVSNKDTENAVVNIKFSSAAVYITDNFGNSVAKDLHISSVEVQHLKKLVFNTKTGTISVVNLNVENGIFDVTLVNCYSGYLFGGCCPQISNRIFVSNNVNDNNRNPITSAAVNAAVNLQEYKRVSLKNLMWEQGSWDVNGNPDRRTNRIRTPLIKGNSFNIIDYLSSEIGSVIYACWYGSNGEFLNFVNYNSVGIKTNTNASYFRLAVQNASNADITPDFINSVTFVVTVEDFDSYKFNAEQCIQEGKYSEREYIIDANYHWKHIHGCVVSDKFKQTSGSAPHLQIDDTLGICFVSYLTSNTQYGETHGMSGLSVFPATQPHKAENYIFAQTGDLDYNGNQLDGAPFETNCLVYRNGNNELKCRCFFNCGNQKLYYRDFDYATRTFDFAAKIVQYNGNDMTFNEMSQIVQSAGYSAWGNENGIIFTSNLYNNYTDNYIYACIEGNSGHPIVIKSNDNFASCQVVAVMPFDCQYECQICELSGTFYLCARLGYDIKLYKTSDWENYSQQIYLSRDSGQRPQCITYNNKVWFFVPTKDSYSGRRQCYKLFSSEDDSTFTLIDEFEEIFGIVYISGQFLNGRLCFAYCTSPFMFSGTGKDDVAFYTVPNIYEGTKPIAIN